MSSPVLIIGAGGHARVLIDALTKSRIAIIGCVAKEPPAQWLSSIPFLGDDETLHSYPPSDFLLVNGIASTGRPELRREIFLKYRRMGYRFGTVVHPTAILPSYMTLGEGAQVMAGAILQPGCCIGENAVVNTGAVIDHDCIIGSHVHIAPGAVISGNVTVGDCVHVGTGARVIQSVEIGEGAVIGAGTVIIRNLLAGSVVVGVPARPLRKPKPSIGKF